MAIQYFPQTKYSSLVSLAVQEQSVAMRVCTGMYQMEGAKIIKAPQLSALTPQPYTPGTALTPATPTDTDFSITINQFTALPFYVDDTLKMFGADISQEQIISGAMSLALEADKYAFGLVNAGTSGIVGAEGSLASPISVTSANVEDLIYLLKEKLDVGNVPADRWLIIPSWMMTKLVKAGLAMNLAQVTADGLWKEGEVYRFAGFNLVVSNSLKVDSTANGYQILAFSSEALPLVGNTISFEMIRTAGLFGTTYQALYAFGASARKDRIAVLSAVKGSEA